jgi:hypothetical protein
MAKAIFQEGKKYTFSDYFDMNNPTEEIVEALGYSLAVQDIQLPHAQVVEPQRLVALRDSYYEILPKITMTSEIAKREVMIAPVLHEVIRVLDAKLNIEYPIDIDEKLSGSIDYFLRSTQAVVIIEAKRGDLDRGFNQLAAELIAVDKYEDSDAFPVLYGALTIGEVWRFATLERSQKTIIKGIHTLRFPEDIEEIVNILSGILRLKHEEPT